LVAERADEVPEPGGVGRAIDGGYGSSVMIDTRRAVPAAVLSAAAMLLARLAAAPAVDATVGLAPRGIPEGRRAYVGGTWTVVAIDRGTGDVGVAGATCLPVDATALAALAPGRGAAAVQADFEVDHRNAALLQLVDGATADEIVAALVRDGHDPGIARRQFGVVTRHAGSAGTATYTGSEAALGPVTRKRPGTP
jgi:hypothetical protein